MLVGAPQFLSAQLCAGSPYMPLFAHKATSTQRTSRSCARLGSAALVAGHRACSSTLQQPCQHADRSRRTFAPPRAAASMPCCRPGGSSRPLVHRLRCERPELHVAQAQRHSNADRLLRPRAPSRSRRVAVLASRLRTRKRSRSCSCLCTDACTTRNGTSLLHTRRPILFGCVATSSCCCEARRRLHWRVNNQSLSGSIGSPGRASSHTRCAELHHQISVGVVVLFGAVTRRTVGEASLALGLSAHRDASDTRHDPDPHASMIRLSLIYPSQRCHMTAQLSGTHWTTPCCLAMRPRPC